MINKKEEAILNSATELFSHFGYHAVGVDLIVEKSNVAKMTFYKYFPSKDILIQRVLVRRGLTLQQVFTDAAARAHTPLGRLKSIFNWYESWLTSSDFNGCMFIKASEEFPEPNGPIKQVVQEHKVWFTKYLAELLSDLSVGNAQKIAKYIAVILEGLSVSSNMQKVDNVSEIRFSWRCVKQIVEANQPA